MLLFACTGDKDPATETDLRSYARSKKMDAAAEKALVANPQNAVAYQNAAEVHRWRADWRRPA